MWPAWCGHRCSLDVVVESALILAFVFEGTWTLVRGDLDHRSKLDG